MFDPESDYKMKFDIFLTLLGPGGAVEAPNNGNPVECKDMESLITELAHRFPKFGFGIEVVGLRVQRVEDAQDASPKQHHHT